MKTKDFKSFKKSKVLLFASVFLLAVMLAMLAGTASAARHCYNDVTLNAAGISFNFAWSLNGEAFPAGEEADNAFTVPPGSSLSFERISTFTYVCENTAQAEVPVPLRVKITRPDGTLETVRNVECISGTTFCDGSGKACDSLDPYFVTNFIMNGTYTLEIEFMQKPGEALINDESNWLPFATYKVKVSTAEISIASPPNRVLLFGEEEEVKTVNNIYWTVYNLSESSITVNDVNFTGCNEVLDCGFQNFVVDEFGDKIPIEIAPKENFILFGIIKAKNPKKRQPPLSNPTVKSISIDVNYSSSGGGESGKGSSQTTLTLVLADLEKFNVKLSAGRENVCIGRNRMIGYSGKAALPKLKFAWTWNSISQNSCDLKSLTDANYIYCDATQFSTEVLKKLQKIEELREQGSGNIAEEIFSLQHFGAFLMKDSFNEDFQNDFTAFALEQFFEAPQWFTEDIDGFKSIFSSTQFFKFTGMQGTSNEVEPLPYPGLYQVDIDLNFLDIASNDYFLAGNPNVIVKVMLTPLSIAPDNNPMYYLPLDGFVGFEDNKQKIERSSYGSSYSGSTVFVNKAGSSAENRVAIKQYSSLQPQQEALAKVTSGLIEDFDSLNNSKRGSILAFSKANPASPNEITLYYLNSTATPVLMKLKEQEVLKQSMARAFYYLRETSNGIASIVSIPENFLNVWTVTSSSIKNAENTCLDFAGNKLFYDRKDNKASNFSNFASCSIPASVTGERAFGLAFDSAPANSFMYLQTVFYTPKNKSFELLDACPDAKANFITPSNSITPGTGTATFIPLNFTSSIENASSYNIESVENIFDLVEQEKVCVTASEESIDFWWNPKHFSQELENSISDTSFIDNKCNIAAAVQG